jgi:hypothetical protein
MQSVSSHRPLSRADGKIWLRPSSSMYIVLDDCKVITASDYAARSIPKTGSFETVSFISRRTVEIKSIIRRRSLCRLALAYWTISETTQSASLTSVCCCDLGKVTWLVEEVTQSEPSPMHSPDSSCKRIGAPAYAPSPPHSRYCDSWNLQSSTSFGKRKTL